MLKYLQAVRRHRRVWTSAQLARRVSNERECCSFSALEATALQPTVGVWRRPMVGESDATLFEGELTWDGMIPAERI